MRGPVVNPVRNLISNGVNRRFYYWVDILGMRKIIIDQEIFNQFPDFKRGVIIVSDIKNAVSNSEIERILDEKIKQKIGKNALEHEFVKAWSDIYLKFGSNLCEGRKQKKPARWSRPLLFRMELFNL